MSLKFICPNCGFELISKYLKPGDMLLCPGCGYEVIVPADAEITEENSNILEILKTKSDEIRSSHYDERPEMTETAEVSKEPTPWGIFSIFKFLIASLILIFVSSCFIGFIIAIVYVAGDPGAIENKELFQNQMGDVAASIMSIIIYIIAVGLIYYSVVKRHHHNFFQGLHIFKISREQVLKYVKLTVIIVFLIALMMVVISFTPLQDFVPKHVPLEDYIGDTFGKLILFSIFALVAPFAEEVIFRGYIYKGFENRVGSIWAGIIVTVAFILIHGPQLAFSAVLLSLIMIVSVVLIYVRIKTDNLTNCIIIHQVYNSILVMIMWIIFLTVGFETHV